MMNAYLQQDAYFKHYKLTYTESVCFKLKNLFIFSKRFCLIKPNGGNMLCCFENSALKFQDYVNIHTCDYVCFLIHLSK